MIRLAALTFVLALVAAGCRTAENVASTSAAVVTAPAHFVRNKLRGDEQPTTETTVYEGQPVEAMPPQASATPFRPSRTVTSRPALRRRPSQTKRDRQPQSRHGRV